MPTIILGRAITAVALTCLVLGLIAAHAAAATITADFDDLPRQTFSNGHLVPTRITDQYQDSHGVYWLEDPGYPPVVKNVLLQAHSGDQVADILSGCGGCELTSPFTHGYFTDTVSSVSLYAGLLGDSNHNTQSTARVQLRAYDAARNMLTQTPLRTVTEGARFTTLLRVDSATANIASFTVSAPDGTDRDELVGFDDLSFEKPAVPPPPDFGFTSETLAVPLRQGLSATVPIAFNRINGSNGDVTFSAVGLPPGVTASFAPDPVPGTGASTTLTLTASADAQIASDFTTATIAATPTSGAGTVERSRPLLVRVEANCSSRVKFPFADVRSECLRLEGERYVASNQAVRINGLLLRPVRRDQRIVVDPAARRITSDGGTYAVSLPGDPELPLFTRAIDWTMPASGGAHKIADIDPASGTKLKGLPLTAAEVFFTHERDAQLVDHERTLLKPTLALSFWPFSYLGGITTTASLVADNDDGVDYEGLELKVGKVPLPAVELQDVELKWTGADWQGRTKVVLKFAGGRTVDARIGVTDGDLAYVSARAREINAPLAAGIYLQRLGLDFRRADCLLSPFGIPLPCGDPDSPWRLRGDIGLSGGPSIAGGKAVTFDGVMTARFGDPFVLSARGAAKLGGRWTLANGGLRYTSDGFVELRGDAKWGLTVGKIEGHIEGWLDRDRAFNLEGDVRGCIYVKWAPDPCASADALVSSVGIAACVHLVFVSGGIGYEWGGDFDLFAGCDLSKYRAVRDASAAAAGGARRVHLPPGLPSAALAIAGTNDPPQVVLSGPHGERVKVSRDRPYLRGRRFVAVAGEDAVTYIVIKRPAGGPWRIHPLEGSSAIRGVRVARGLPEPWVNARVGGKGRRRTLIWRLRQIPGQRVRFVELGRGAARVIATARARRGSVHFRPAPGPAGRRRIVALVEQDGMPRRNLRIGSYLAPPRARPAKPQGLRLRRRGDRLQVSWHTARLGFRHLVHLRLGDGRLLALTVAVRRRSVTIAAVGRGVGARVTVTGLTRLNMKGPATRLRIKPGQRESGARRRHANGGDR